MPQAAISANRAGSAVDEGLEGRPVLGRRAPRNGVATTSAMRAVSPGPRQSGRPIAQQVVDAADPGRLEVDQHRHHLERARARRRRTGRRPRRRRAGPGRRRGPRSRGTASAWRRRSMSPSWAKNGGTTLSHADVAVRERQAPDAGQVPAADLLRRPDALDPPAGEHVLGPREVAVRAAGHRPAQAERLVVERDVEREQGLGGQRRPRDRCGGLGEVRDPAAVRARQLGIEHPEHDDLEPVRLADGLDDGLDVRPPARRDRHLGQAADRRPVGRDERRRPRGAAADPGSCG